MTIGFMGLGKLGLPVALAVESKGYTVVGHDINPKVAQYLQDRAIPFLEQGIQPLLDKTNIELVGTEELVGRSDIIFCAIQTPHAPEFEGATRLPNERKDFDYTYLKSAVKEIAELSTKLDKRTTLVVISTCLPGTFNREIKPLLNDHIEYIYNPFFIAMGTVVENFLHPEFVLVGSENTHTPDKIKWLYESLHNKPLLETDITSAEAIKVSYNTFITMKTVLANTWGELCHKTGANVDDLFKAWSLSTERLISPRYLQSGVGDGGGCHPRDNIALSYIADEVGLSHNLFEDLMKAREEHMGWLATETIRLASTNSLPIVVLGRSFKPETNIETGSPAILMASILSESGHTVTHVEDLESLPVAVYTIATKHGRYKEYAFPTGSIVLDPFRYIPDQPGVQVIRVGATMSSMQAQG